MYQVNYLPWREALWQKKIIKWLFQLIVLIIISLTISGYIAYYLKQKLHTLTTQQRQLEQQENSLSQQRNLIEQTKHQTYLSYQHYWLYYQNWYQSLQYIALFQTIEECLPSAGWVDHFSNNQHQLLIQFIVPNENALFFISCITSSALMSSFILTTLQQSETYPSYSKAIFQGDWEQVTSRKQDNTFNSKEENNTYDR